MNVKGKGQRLIPEELLKYLEAYKEAHPDPTQGGGATLDDIVDSQGNKRFIEGNGTPATLSGLTSSYCKWSLSGTHLMLVFAGKWANGSTFNTGDTLVSFIVPNFIAEKIYPVWETVGGLENSSFVLANVVGGGDININCTLRKNTENPNELYITLATGYTLSQDKFFRIQFDLLIDSDYE